MCAPNGQAGAFGAKIYLYGQTGELIGMREAKALMVIWPRMIPLFILEPEIIRKLP